MDFALKQLLFLRIMDHWFLYWTIEYCNGRIGKRVEESLNQKVSEEVLNFYFIGCKALWYLNVTAVFLLELCEHFLLHDARLTSLKVLFATIWVQNTAYNRSPNSVRSVDDFLLFSCILVLKKFLWFQFKCHA